MGETKSKTERDSFIEERIFGLGDHYKTTISDGERTVEELGSTAKEAEERASDAWEKSGKK